MNSTPEQQTAQKQKALSIEVIKTIGPYYDSKLKTYRLGYINLKKQTIWIKGSYKYITSFANLIWKRFPLAKQS